MKRKGNQSQDMQNSAVSQSEITRSWRKVRENARVQVTSHWVKKWRECCQPITERSHAKPKQAEFTFDTQIKPLKNEKKKKA